MKTALLALGLLAAAALSATARDNGQWKDVDPATRQWFKAQRSPSGVPCCDTADGMPTTWRATPDDYEVLIGGEWVTVPPDTIIRGTGNPTGEAIVWIWFLDGKPKIRCFIPAAEG